MLKIIENYTGNVIGLVSRIEDAKTLVNSELKWDKQGAYYVRILSPAEMQEMKKDCDYCVPEIKTYVFRLEK